MKNCRSINVNNKCYPIYLKYEKYHISYSEATVNCVLNLPNNMQILTVSATNHPNASNVRLLKALAVLDSPHEFMYFEQLADLPLFSIEKAENQLVKDWKATVKKADAVIFTTPEYLHNLPAVLKNALEWLTSGGELTNKKTIAMTCTPHAPRGEKAMQSLLWSLHALDANVILKFPVYAVNDKLNDANEVIDKELQEILAVALEQL